MPAVFASQKPREGAAGKLKSLQAKRVDCQMQTGNKRYRESTHHSPFTIHHHEPTGPSIYNSYLRVAIFLLGITTS
jgi:hypothetical protein